MINLKKIWKYLCESIDLKFVSKWVINLGIIFFIFQSIWILNILSKRKKEHIRSCDISGEPIDVVYTWVNGSDPTFIRQLNKFRPNDHNDNSEEDSDPARYRGHYLDSV